MPPVEHRSLESYDWRTVAAYVSENGYALLPSLVPAEHCRRVASLYDEPKHFRSHVRMARHGFGRGEYRYFAYPLPPWLAALRTQLYARLAPIANEWAQLLQLDAAWPQAHDEYIRRCHDNGQQRPTPLLLRYRQDDYNCLHQDLYGALWFPLQVVILLDQPGEDFAGGELLIVEQRPRAQSRGSVISLQQGDAAVIAVNYRPKKSVRGYARVTLRHGVSTLIRGQRHALGVIFHDAT